MTAIIILSSFNTFILLSFIVIMIIAIYHDQKKKRGLKNGTNKKTFTKLQNKKL